MEIVEERTVVRAWVPTISKRGFDSTLIGFTAIAIFMIGDYNVFA